MSTSEEDTRGCRSEVRRLTLYCISFCAVNFLQHVQNERAKKKKKSSMITTLYDECFFQGVPSMLWYSRGRAPHQSRWESNRSDLQRLSRVDS